MANLRDLYTVKQLPSGFWSVWFGGEWFCAALRTKEEAEDLIEAFVNEYIEEEERIEMEEYEE